MKRLVLLVALVVVVSSCGAGDPPGTLESATAETRAVLEETAGALFPSHTYSVEVIDPWGANCTKPGGVVDSSRNSVVHQLVFDLQAGDDPLEMAARLVEYWESLGFDVNSHDFGNGSVAGTVPTDEGGQYGYIARSLDYPHRLTLESTTPCYRTE